jgi:hypothetical protein
LKNDFRERILVTAGFPKQARNIFEMRQGAGFGALLFLPEIE